MREPVNNEAIDKPLENHYDGEGLVIPVMQELVVVKKQLVLTERIKIRKRQVVEEQETRETIRQERVEIEDRVQSVNNFKGTVKQRGLDE